MEGKRFGEYMDAAMEGTAYLGPGGGWRSVRDTWCNSDGNNPARTHPRRRRRLGLTRGTHHPRDRMDVTDEEGFEEILRDGSAGNLEAGSEKDGDKSSDESFVEALEEHDSEDEFRGEE